MPKPRFILKDPSSTEETLILLKLEYDKIRFKHSTGIKIHPKFWNAKGQCVREVTSLTLAGDYNETLRNLKNGAEAYHRALINAGIFPTPDKIKNKLDEILLKKNYTDLKDLIKFIENLISTSNKSKGTIKQYKTAQRVITEFCNHLNRKYMLDDINLDFYEGLISYLTNIKKYSPNTIGTIIKNLKVFMNEALERGLTANVQFKSKRFKKQTEKSESIYLTIQEIEKIYTLKLQPATILDRVRDLFIVGCYTGLRFSDLSKLTKDNIVENGSMLKIKTQKTDSTLIIPLHDFVKEIIKKHEGFPKPVNNVKMNFHLKEIAESAKIKEDVIIHYTKGGEKKAEVFKKFNLVTVHTARRSFATNAFINGVPTISIMKITGHNTERTFLSYIKISQETNATKLLDHPFFNTKTNEKHRRTTGANTRLEKKNHNV